MKNDRKHVVIIGGGIAGLATAYYLNKKSSGNLRISLLDAEGYWGGKLVTDRTRGFVIEGGPDTFIVTKPWAVELCKELGIAERLRGTNPNKKNTYILHKDELHPLPGGLTMMIPTEFGPMIRSGLLSWPAKVRMGLDFLLPAAVENGDESMGDFITRRIGRQAYERLIEPLMSGIYAGDGDKLSIQATLPYLRSLEKQHGGLVRGALALRRQRTRMLRDRNKGSNPQAMQGSRSIFLTPLTGLAEIVEAIISNLEENKVELHLNTYVENVIPAGEGYKIDLKDGNEIFADGVILAAQAFASGDMIASFAADISRELNAIEYVSTATVSLAFKEEHMVRPLDGYGYVIPRCEGRKALACTWTSTKFPHRTPEKSVLIRVFVGRAGQEEQITWDDESLLAIAREELELTLGITAEPILTRVYQWQNAMPQYNVGHPARLERLDEMMANYPQLALAGNGYQGIGIPDCIHSGELATDRIIQSLENLKTTTLGDTR